MGKARRIALFSPVFAIVACGLQYSTAPTGDSATDAASSSDALPQKDSALTSVNNDGATSTSDGGFTPQPSTLPECTAQRVVSLVGGDGGLAWFTLVWPVPDMIENYAPGDAYDNPAFAVSVIDSTVHPLYARLTNSTPVMTGTGNAPEPTVFVAGTNQSHTTLPTELQVNGVDVTWLGVQAQSTLMPLQSLVLFGNAAVYMGGEADAGPAPLVATSVTDAIMSLQSKGVPTSTLSALAPDGATLGAWGIDEATPTDLSDLANELLFAENSFRLGVASTVVIPALEDDPHGAFATPAATMTTTTTANTLTLVLQSFYKDLAGMAEPSCSHNGMTISLADNVMLIVTGDTPKNSYEATGWPDGSPGNSNWIYARTNGWLVPGWFGSITSAARSGFNSTTGAIDANVTSATDQTAAGLALYYAITRGNTALVSAFDNAAYKGSVASPTP